MRIVDCVKDFSRNEFEFKSGNGYVMPEDTESQFRSVAGECFGMSHPIEARYRPYKGEDLSGKSILIFRQGGLGDVGGFLLPVICHLKKKYPTCYIRIATGCREPLLNIPEIDELHNMPFNVELFDKSDVQLFFQGIIESSSEKSKITHAVDMFYSYFNIDSTHLPFEDKRPKLAFTTAEMDWLGAECKTLGIEDKDIVVGIQIETSAPLRNYPKEHFKRVVDILAKEENTKIVLIGSPQQAYVAGYLKGNYGNVIAAVNYDIRKSIVLANRYNIIIAPDSFFVQVAGALTKPLIGIYGPFASEVRMKYFKNAIGLEPKVVCSPCFKHDFRSCIKGSPSPCFSLVTPEDILETADYLRSKHYGGHFNYMGRLLSAPDFSEIEQYFLSADKGVCFFGGYFKHHNMISVDTNRLVDPDISNLNEPFNRGCYPFVVFMNNFGHQNGTLYNNTKTFVRPGGYFITVKNDCTEQYLNEIKRDLGKSFTIIYSKMDPAAQVGIVVGKKPY